MAAAIDAWEGDTSPVGGKRLTGEAGEPFDLERLLLCAVLADLDDPDEE
jgi:hypothetical protein